MTAGDGVNLGGSLGDTVKGSFFGKIDGEKTVLFVGFSGKLCEKTSYRAQNIYTIPEMEPLYKN